MGTYRGFAGRMGINWDYIGTIAYILGLCRDNGVDLELYGDYRVYILGYLGIVDNRMETISWAGQDSEALCGESHGGNCKRARLLLPLPESPIPLKEYSLHGTIGSLI